MIHPAEQARIDAMYRRSEAPAWAYVLVAAIVLVILLAIGYAA